MHLAKRAALAAAVLCLSAGLTACKKKESEAKKDEPAAKADDKGSGSGSGSASGTPDKPADTKADALAGFKGAMAEVKAGAVEGIGGGGGMGGIAGKLGGLFGGGAAKTAAPAEPGAQDGDRHAMGAGQDPSANAAAEAPPAAAAAELKFPPAGQPGGGCDKVTERLMIIIDQMMERELGELTAEQKAAAASEIKAQMDSVEGEVMKMCTDQNWSQELKDCALTAMSEADFDKCDQYAPEELQDPPVADEDGDGEYEPGEDYPEAPAQPLAAWTGGDDCKAVGDRMVQLTMAQVGELPDEYKAQVEQELAESATQLATMCTEGNWSAEVRKCFLAAGTIDVAGECFGQLGGGM